MVYVHASTLYSMVLLYIKFKFLKIYVFIRSLLITTKSDFDILVRANRQLFGEPRWTVKGATGVESTTTFTIPEGIIEVETIFIIL